MHFEEGCAVIYAPREPHDQLMESDGEDLCVQIALPPGMGGRLKAGIFVPRVNQPWMIEEIQQLCRSRGQPGGLEQRIFDLRASAVLLALVDIAMKNSKEDSLPQSERHVMQAGGSWTSTLPRSTHFAMSPRMWAYAMTICAIFS